jgi:5'-nucleotidase
LRAGSGEGNHGQSAGAAAAGGLHIDQRVDGRGNPYYWIAYSRLHAATASEGTDIAAIDSHRITVTPLKIDITDEPMMARLTKLFKA